MFKRSQKLNAILDKYDTSDLFDYVEDVFDGTCTTGYDNDGSTGLEIFENGVNLGIAANGSSIFIYTDKNTALFFIGEEGHIVAKVKKAIKESGIDDD